MFQPSRPCGRRASKDMARRECGKLEDQTKAEDRSVKKTENRPGKKAKNKYLTLFLSTLKLSAFTFGGGFVIIPLMRKKFVEELGWIDEQEMIDLTAIAQSSPGAIAVNASILVGYRVAGIPGAMLTVIGTVIPPLVIISAISFFYRAFRDSRVVGMIMAGMMCGVAAVIVDVVINMAKTVFKQKRILPVIVMAAAFVATRFFSVNIIIIILACGLTGAAYTFIRDRNSRKKAEKKEGGNGDLS